mmetsp:Transcript_16647/g.45051  ORF Transcript_16647/g.45051 Transcript_16647/m.45051 type:complete len:202 (-) Transcript_16647:656-1261(-)
MHISHEICLRELIVAFKNRLCNSAKEVVVHSMHLGEGVDVVDQFSQWSQGHRSGTSQHGVSQGIEELAVTRLQLAKGHGQDTKTVFRCCIQTFVFHVLDPRCSTAHQHLARHASLSDGSERLTHGVHVEEVQSPPTFNCQEIKDCDVLARELGQPVQDLGHLRGSQRVTQRAVSQSGRQSGLQAVLMNATFRIRPRHRGAL